ARARGHHRPGAPRAGPDQDRRPQRLPLLTDPALCRGPACGGDRGEDRRDRRRELGSADPARASRTPVRREARGRPPQDRRCLLDGDAPPFLGGRDHRADRSHDPLHRLRAVQRDRGPGSGVAMPGVRDRVAVVTGAASGLGREIAQLLAREGASVVLGDIETGGLERTAAAIIAAGGTALTVAGDLTEEAPARRLIDAAIDRFGRVEILVNVVGGSRNAKIWEMRVEDWDFVLRLNLRSTFLCTRAAVPHMIRQKHGRIVCMSSGAREGTPWTAYYQGGSAYSA